MDFSHLNLDALLQKALVACNYSTPTPIQAQAIPVILEGKDIAASAETGSGKTAAFVLPALNHLQKQGASKQSRVLILTPTRELAAQIAKAAHQYGKFMRFRIVCLVGGLPYHQQIRDLSRGADIIVATPGRLLDHVRSNRVDLTHIEMLILDEADRMLDMGFIEDIETVVDETPESRQTLLFSATLDKNINNIIKRLMKNPVHVDLSKDIITAENIKQVLYRAQNAHHKSAMLRQFLNDENIFKAIIFSATKVNAERLAQDLCDDGFSAASLHGDLRQRVRDRTVDQLRSGKIQFLVATDVAARGIDISDITHVFNYDLPRDGEDYVHRIGRTGRAGKHGTAISFVTSAEFRILQRIERYIGKRLPFEQTEGSSNFKTNDTRDMNDRRNSRSNDGRDRFAKRKFNDDTASFRGKEKPFDRRDKPSRPFKEKSFDDNRPSRPSKEKSFDDNRGDRFAKRKFNDDTASFRGKEKPFDRRDKPSRPFKEKSFDDNRPSRPSKEKSLDDNRSDRFAKRKFNDDTAPFRGKEKSFDRRDKPSRPFKEKSLDDNRGDRFAKRKFNDDTAPFRGKEKSFDHSDKPKRSFKEKTSSEQRSTSNKPFSDASEFSERKPRKSPSKPSRSFKESSTGRFSKEKSSRDQKPKRSFGGERFHGGGTKTTTWRKKESA